MKQIITIGREFGAGGGELGRRLARELGIAYYDRDIILRTAFFRHCSNGTFCKSEINEWVYGNVICPQ